MLKLSTKGRYGTRLMLELALNYNKGPILLKDIAQRQEISLGYLEHLVPLLKSNGLIHSARGAHGGYSLARPPQSINVADIVQALEGNICLVECVAQPKLCSRISSCVTRSLWSEVGRKIVQTLASFTLADLVKQCKKKRENILSYNI